MKKSMMDRTSKKKMRRRRMKNCGYKKGREDKAAFKRLFVSAEESSQR